MHNASTRPFFLFQEPCLLLCPSQPPLTRCCLHALHAAICSASERVTSAHSSRCTEPCASDRFKWRPPLPPPCPRQQLLTSGRLGAYKLPPWSETPPLLPCPWQQLLTLGRPGAYRMPSWSGIECRLVLRRLQAWWCTPHQATLLAR